MPKKYFQHEKGKYRKIETTLHHLLCVDCVDFEAGRWGVLEVTSTRTPVPTVRGARLNSKASPLHVSQSTAVPWGCWLFRLESSELYSDSPREFWDNTFKCTTATKLYSLDYTCSSPGISLLSWSILQYTVRRNNTRIKKLNFIHIIKYRLGIRIQIASKTLPQ
jgi:hypothetical protein